MNEPRDCAYDAGFKTTEPRDWHGRWAYSEYNKLANSVQIKKIDELDYDVYSELKRRLHAMDSRDTAENIGRVAKGINESFDEISKKAPGVLNYVPSEGWKGVQFVFADYGEELAGISMTTYSDIHKNTAPVWIANVGCIPHMIGRIKDGKGINFASKWLHDHPGGDQVTQYFRMCMEHEFAHWLDITNTHYALSRDFARVIVDASGVNPEELRNPFLVSEKFHNWIAENISVYANSEPSEAFAEAFNRWLVDENFHPQLKAFFDYHFKQRAPTLDAAMKEEDKIHNYPDPKKIDKNGNVIINEKAWKEAIEESTKDTTIGVEFFTNKEAPPSYTERALGTSQANKGENEFARQEKYSRDTRGAGLALIDPNGYMLFVKRDDHADHGGKWAIPGGNVEHHETPEQAAEREAIEEIGYVSSGKYPLSFTTHEPVKFETFVAPVENQFEPSWLMEHSAYVWRKPNNPPEPLHPGVRSLLYQMRGYNATH